MNKYIILPTKLNGAEGGMFRSPQNCAILGRRG